MIAKRTAWTRLTPGLLDWIERFRCSHSSRALASIILIAVCQRPLLAGIDHWTGGGPFGGVVNALAQAPSPASTLYCGTNANGVFRSDDGGASWQRASADGLRGVSAIEVASDSTLFATQDGVVVTVFKSVDGGSTWSSSTAGLAGTTARALASDPVTPAHLYLATRSTGVFESADSGSTWNASNTGLPTPLPESYDLEIDPLDPTTVYLATRSDGIFESTDGGAHWSAINAGLPSPLPRILDLEIDPVTPSTIYAATRTQGVFKSLNGGASWSASSSDIAGYGIGTLAVDPGYPQNVYAGSLWGSGAYKSTDGGSSWAALPVGSANDAIHHLLVHHSDGATVFAATEVGFELSPDGGASWSTSNLGLSAYVADGLEADPATAGVVHAWDGTAGPFRSSDYAATWQQANQAVGSGRGWTLTVAPSQPQRLFLATNQGELMRSDDGGNTWSSVIADSAPFGDWGVEIEALAVDPTNENVVFAGNYTYYFDGFPAQPIILKSSDGGAQWSTLYVPTDLPHSWIDPVSIAVDPALTDRLLVGSLIGVPGGGRRCNVLRSLDGGVNWSETFDRENCFPTLAIDPSRVDTAYLGLWGLGAASELYATSDGGGSWSSLGLPPSCAPVRDLAVDSAGRVYVACDVVWYSDDAGASWERFYRNGLPSGQMLIRSIASSSASPSTLYIGTSAGGFGYTFGTTRIFDDGFESGDTSAWSGGAP